MTAEAPATFAAAVETMLIRANEAAIDDALFNLARVREQLVGLDMNTAACLVDEAIEDIEDRCRAVFRRRAFRDDPVGRDLQLVEVNHG